ncbi:NAD(P)H-hydrate dehydratase [Breoghania sp. L-A4]|nr:NAD(P)H-hydrate dehydratase [Breoghania sp. L-A4]
MELLTPSQMAEADRLAVAAGVGGEALMEAAGTGVARVLAERWPPPARVLVLAGPGNNGGDGFVAARVLHALGYTVSIGLLGDRARLAGDALGAFEAMDASLREALCPANPSLLADCDVVIDALFGAGLARDLTGPVATLVDALNASRLSVVAVDLPSGVDGETGAVRGVAVRATETVTFFRRKPGHLLYPGRGLCGVQHVIDIGTPAGVLESIDPRTHANAPALWRHAWRAPSAVSHKYQRGHVVVASGPAHATGAARLAATAALRAGAGLVTMASPPGAVLVNACHLTAVMIRSVRDAERFSAMLDDPRVTSVAIGPGFGVGERTRAFVNAALGARFVVLDADALTSFSDDPAVLFDAIRAAGALEPRAVRVVLTPHDGEFARLFPSLAALPSRLERARAAASHSGAVVILKGADTVIAAPDGRAAINENAPPWLASAGSGDVLCGLVAGLGAQAMPAFEAACMAVWCHGAAGAQCGPGLIAEDLPPAMPAVLAPLCADASTKSCA